MPKLVDSTSISKLDENEIMTYISLHLRLEVHPKDKMLMRIGIRNIKKVRKAKNTL